jgi:DNA-directed RNA polymerase subunit A'
MEDLEREQLLRNRQSLDHRLREIPGAVTTTLGRWKAKFPDGKYTPGVNYVIRKDGRRVKVTEKNAGEVAERLEIGSLIERQLQEGDVVLFNRQPSLHRMSMMAHKVRVMPGKTFRLHLSVCPPYNADFDGDEMNLHVLQGEEARAEAEILMKVQEHIMSPRFGGPIIGCIHDHISGAFLLTWRRPRISVEDAQQMLQQSGISASLENVKKDDRGRFVTGADLFSMLLPKGLHMRFKAAACKDPHTMEQQCPQDFCPVIEDGKLIAGAIDEKAIAAFKGQLLERIVRTLGNEEARQFLDTVTKIGVAYLTYRGFTTGIDDEDLPALPPEDEVLSLDDLDDDDDEDETTDILDEEGPADLKAAIKD